MKMGQRNREIVEEKWSWKVRSHDWFKFIKNSLET